MCSVLARTSLCLSCCLHPPTCPVCAFLTTFQKLLSASVIFIRSLYCEDGHFFRVQLSTVNWDTKLTKQCGVVCRLSGPYLLSKHPVQYACCQEHLLDYYPQSGYLTAAPRVTPMRQQNCCRSYSDNLGKEPTLYCVPGTNEQSFGSWEPQRGHGLCLSQLRKQCGLWLGAVCLRTRRACVFACDVPAGAYIFKWVLFLWPPSPLRPDKYLSLSVCACVQPVFPYELHMTLPRWKVFRLCFDQ